MPRIAKPLTALQVKTTTKTGYNPVGTVPGLYLQVASSGTRSWVLRATVAGKRREMGLGPYPAVPLQAAHEAARRAWEQIRSGVDPVAVRRASRSALAAERAKAVTFKACAASYVESHEAAWKNAKHAQQWTNTLQTYAHPYIGELLVRDVGLPHVLDVLQPIWKTKTETASRLRGRIDAVLDWATVRGLREGPNPARWRGHLDKLLPKPAKVMKRRNSPAVPVQQAGAFMAALRERGGIGARALELLALTVVRSQNVRAARWSEFDLDAATWTIPGDSEGGPERQRMKSGKEHRVPLPPAAVELLRKLPRVAGTDVVFPAPRGSGVLSDMTLSALMRRMGFKDKTGELAVPHGLRSTFRDWAADRTSYPREVAEAALAHTVENRTEAAYWRSDVFDKRRRMMADWAAFLATVETKGTVVPLSRLHG